MAERFETIVRLVGKTVTMFGVLLDSGRSSDALVRLPWLRSTNSIYPSTIVVYGDRHCLPPNRNNRRGAVVAAGGLVEGKAQT